MNYITAIEMADACGIERKRFRQALRDAELPWHGHGTPWAVEISSSQHRDMQAVLQQLIRGSAKAAEPPRSREPGQRPDGSDEAYVLGLCDEVLGQKASRQHCFDFLRGDAGQRGSGRMLPVDAWYPELMLVIEYREMQHSEKVEFFDRKPTVSGVGRGEQRRLYDQRRRQVLPIHGIELVEFDYFEFRHTSNRRLVRCDADLGIVSKKLRRFAV